MFLKFWGVRGSIATPGPDTDYFGGNTACIEVTSGSTRLILDAGTGLRSLGHQLIKTSPRGKQTFHILLSHCHIDHLYGLPFFEPLYAKTGHRIHIYGPAGSRRPLRRILDSLFSRELFPVLLKEMPAHLTFHSLGERSFHIGDFKISSFYINHPGKTLGYIIEAAGRRFGYLTDHEPSSSFCHSKIFRQRNHPQDLLQRLKGLDLLIHDAHFLDREYSKYRGWGHSPWSYALDLACQAGVRQLALFHHSPDHNDEDLKMAFARLKNKASKKHSPKILLPRESTMIRLK